MVDIYDVVELALFLTIVYFVFAFFFSLLHLVMELSIQCFDDITKCPTHFPIPTNFLYHNSQTNNCEVQVYG